MNCVQCKQPMVTAELDGVEIDFCPACGGVWLDSGELESLLGDEVSARQTVGSLQQALKTSEQHKKCPICRKKMEKVHASAVSSMTLLDRCPAHGLWFDKGELQRVLESGTLDSEGKAVQLLKTMFGS